MDQDQFHGSLENETSLLSAAESFALTVSHING
jgi:hypothetical protein